MSETIRPFTLQTEEGSDYYSDAGERIIFDGETPSPGVQIGELLGTRAVQTAMLGADATGLFQTGFERLARPMEANGEIVARHLQILGNCSGRFLFQIDPSNKFCIGRPHVFKQGAEAGTDSWPYVIQRRRLVSS